MSGDELSAHADHLNAIDAPDPGAKAFYDIMSGALVWSDETTPETPTAVVWALRRLLAYRTRAMLDSAEPDNDFWTRCVAMFPNWIGFLPERRKQTPELLAEYRRGGVSLKRCLRKIEGESVSDV